MEAPVVPGETVDLDLMVFDVGDDQVDSLVLLDGFEWIAADSSEVLPNGCPALPLPAVPGTWSKTLNLSTPQASHTATLLPDGRVLVVGGQTAPGDGNALLRQNSMTRVPTLGPQQEPCMLLANSTRLHSLPMVWSWSPVGNLSMHRAMSKC